MACTNAFFQAKKSYSLTKLLSNCIVYVLVPLDILFVCNVIQEEVANGLISYKPI